MTLKIGVIQVEWTQKVCITETRRNLIPLVSRGPSNIHKYATFDGPLQLSQKKTIGRELESMVRAASVEVSDHLKSTSLGNRRVKHMILRWKIGLDKKVYFIGCFHLQMVSESSNKYFLAREGRTHTIPENMIRKRKDFDYNYQREQKYSRIQYKNIRCLNCMQTTIPQKMVCITNDAIIKYHNLKKKKSKTNKTVEVQSIDKSVAKFENDSPKRKSSVRILGSRLLLNSTMRSIPPKVSSKSIWNPRLRIPVYFRRKYDINVKNRHLEDLFVTDRKFRKHKETPICFDCYLLITEQVSTIKNCNIFSKNKNNSKGSKNDGLSINSRVDKLKELLSFRRETNLQTNHNLYHGIDTSFMNSYYSKGGGDEAESEYREASKIIQATYQNQSHSQNRDINHPRNLFLGPYFGTRELGSDRKIRDFGTPKKRNTVFQIKTQLSKTTDVGSQKKLLTDVTLKQGTSNGGIEFNDMDFLTDSEETVPQKNKKQKRRRKEESSNDKSGFSNFHRSRNQYRLLGTTRKNVSDRQVPKFKFDFSSRNNIKLSTDKKIRVDNTGSKYGGVKYSNKSKSKIKRKFKKIFEDIYS